MALPMILQQLGTNSQVNPQINLAPIKQTIQALKASQNPQALMQQMMMQKNPGMQQALSYIQQHGNDPAIPRVRRLRQPDAAGFSLCAEKLRRGWTEKAEKWK